AVELARVGGVLEVVAVRLEYPSVRVAIGATAACRVLADDRVHRLQRHEVEEHAATWRRRRVARDRHVREGSVALRVDRATSRIRSTGAYVGAVARERRVRIEERLERVDRAASRFVGGRGEVSRISTHRGPEQCVALTIVEERTTALFGAGAECVE